MSIRVSILGHFRQGGTHLLQAPIDCAATLCYNRKVLVNQRFPLKNRHLGVFAPLVGALVFKTSVGFGKSSKWVRFPYTPVFQDSALDVPHGATGPVIGTDGFPSPFSLWQPVSGRAGGPAT